MKKLILPIFLSFSLLGVVTPSYAFACAEYKTFVSNKTGKEAAKDAPSWVKQAGHKPCKNPNESGNQFAKRILDAKYGVGNWKTGLEPNTIKLRNMATEHLNNWNIYEKFSLCSLSHKSR